MCEKWANLGAITEMKRACLRTHSAEEISQRNWCIFKKKTIWSSFKTFWPHCHAEDNTKRVIYVKIAWGFTQLHPSVEIKPTHAFWCTWLLKTISKIGLFLAAITFSRPIWSKVLISRLEHCSMSRLDPIQASFSSPFYVLKTHCGCLEIWEPAIFQGCKNVKTKFCRVWVGRKFFLHNFNFSWKQIHIN